MKVAVLHYHFDRGGVTRVVSSTLQGFDNYPGCSFGLLSGRPVHEIDAPTSVIPGLDYSTGSSTAPDPDSLYREVIREARTLFRGEDPDVWHIHNPALGKNTAFTGLVARLARDGRALLLHEHDFAEDFRPANYTLRESHRAPGDPAFPYSARVRYAVLNERDARLLAQAGLPDEFLVRLPNPVPPTPLLPPVDPNSALILYPVRALARKNLGEFLLLAQAMDADLRWQSTLPPTNPAYQPRFEDWKKLAAELSLPVELGAAASGHETFEERMAAARAVVTTSVAEGFGLSFLEPWTHGRPVFGRDLPEVTEEFRSQGISLQSFYREFPIPAEAVDLPTVAESWCNGLESAYQAFGIDAPAEAIRSRADSIRRSPTVDFSSLSEPLQMDALRTISEKGIPTRPPVQLPDPDSDRIARMRALILESYSLPHYVDRLANVYTALANSESEPLSSLAPRDILGQFLHPARFHPHFGG